MNNDNNHIICSTHDEAFAIYVCGHLVKNPAQQWFSDFPSEKNSWPDAWCSKCEAEYLKESELNKSSKEYLAPKIICNHCYESAIAMSVDFLKDEALKLWLNTISECHDELSEKQKLLETKFLLSKHKRWDYDQTKSLLVFSNDDIPAVFADIEFIGSVSTRSNTWLWSWANFHDLPEMRTRIKDVRDFGEKLGFPRLTVPKWKADQIDGWEVSGIAAHVLRAQGVYRVLYSNGLLFMALMNVWSVN